MRQTWCPFSLFIKNSTNKRSKNEENKICKKYTKLNLKTNKERKGQAKFYPSVTNSVGETLSNYLIDYIKKGGDINNLTPDNVFKKWLLF